jgi:hypothetical protein
MTSDCRLRAYSALLHPAGLSISCLSLSVRWICALSGPTCCGEMGLQETRQPSTQPTHGARSRCHPLGTVLHSCRLVQASWTTQLTMSSLFSLVPAQLRMRCSTSSWSKLRHFRIPFVASILASYPMLSLCWEFADVRNKAACARGLPHGYSGQAQQQS